MPPVSVFIRFWFKSAASIFLVLLCFTVLAVWLPHFTPDSQILVESDMTGNWDIYRMDMNRDILINLTHNPSNDHDASWSARTQQIAFSSDRDHDTATEIYVIGEGGGHLRRVTPPDGIYWKPTWLPDGRLAVVFNFGSIQILNLTTHTNDFLGYGFAPIWSPDGRSIAYDIDQRLRTSSDVDIYTMDANGHNVKNLTGSPTNDWNPVWSPDGKSIAFSSTRDANTEIYVMNVTCKLSSPCQNSVARLTNNVAIDQFPSWSPDGQHLIFESNRDGTRQIYLMNTDGSGVQKITAGKSNHSAPVWIK